MFGQTHFDVRSIPKEQPNLGYIISYWAGKLEVVYWYGSAITSLWVEEWNPQDLHDFSHICRLIIWVDYWHACCVAGDLWPMESHGQGGARRKEWLRVRAAVPGRLSLLPFFHHLGAHDSTLPFARSRMRISLIVKYKESPIIDHWLNNDLPPIH